MTSFLNKIQAVAEENPIKFAAVGAATVGAVGLVVLYKWATKPSSTPDFDHDDAWFKKEVYGLKDCDCFFAHPTSSVGALRWNVAWEGRGKKIGGFVSLDEARPAPLAVGGYPFLTHVQHVPSTGGRGP